MLFLLAVLSIVVGVVLNGFVLAKLWAWFIVPVFSLPVLGVAQAVGLALIVACLTYQYVDDENQDKEDVNRVVKIIVHTTILRPFLVLFIAWIVTLFL